MPCFSPPRLLPSGASFYRILSVASDAPVRGTGFTPGRSSPGASAVLHSAPVAPFRGVFLTYSLRCLGCSSPWHRVLPRTILSGGLGRAPLCPGCSNPGRLFAIFSPLPRTLQSVAPGSPPDDPVRGLVPCFIPPRLLQSGPSFYRILSVASDAPIRGTCFNPGQSSPGASAVLHSAPVAPIRGVFFNVFSPLPRLLQSVAPGSPPDDPVRGLGPRSTPPWMLQSGASFRRILSFASDAPVRGLVPCFIPPWLLQSEASFYRFVSVAWDAPVRGTGLSPGRSRPGASAVLHSAPVAPIQGIYLSYSLRCLGCSSPWHLVRPRTIQSGG